MLGLQNSDIECNFLYSENRLWNSTLLYSPAYFRGLEFRHFHYNLEKVNVRTEAHRLRALRNFITTLTNYWIITTVKGIILISILIIYLRLFFQIFRFLISRVYPESCLFFKFRITSFIVFASRVNSSPYNFAVLLSGSQLNGILR